MGCDSQGKGDEDSWNSESWMWGIEAWTQMVEVSTRSVNMYYVDCRVRVIPFLRVMDNEDNGIGRNEYVDLCNGLFYVVWRIRGLVRRPITEGASICGNEIILIHSLL